MNELHRIININNNNINDDDDDDDDDNDDDDDDDDDDDNNNSNNNVSFLKRQFQQRQVAMLKSANDIRQTPDKKLGKYTQYDRNVTSQ